MKKIIVENEFWKLFPNAKIGVVIAKDFDNSILNSEKYQEILKNAQIKAWEHLDAEIFTDNSAVKVWREAYQKFKTKKGARSSIEALLKRVKNGQQINSINPLVDIYNAVSLEFGLPCGGEDLNLIVGDLKLTNAQGDEDFVTLGSEKQEPPYPNEIIYKDDFGAICRCLNWRESTRTMLTEKTKNSVLFIELVDSEKSLVLETALAKLSQMIQSNLGGNCQIQILTQKKYETIID